MSIALLGGSQNRNRSFQNLQGTWPSKGGLPFFATLRPRTSPTFAGKKRNKENPKVGKRAEGRLACGDTLGKLP